MKYLMLACLLVVGCGKGEEVVYPAKTYKPSELIEMATLPGEVIKVSGKVYQFDKPNNEQRWFFSIEDGVIKTVEDDKQIVIVFDSKDKEFSESLRKWFNELYKGRHVTIKGKPVRLPSDDKKRVYIYDPEIQ